MSDAVFQIGSGRTRRTVDLFSYLDRSAEERATDAALAWIKALRHAQVDGQPLRRRFTFRDDSLWWFAELYLHKQQTIEHIFRTVAALNALLEREQPSAIEFVSGASLVRGIAPQLASARGVGYSGARGLRRSPTVALAAMEARAVSLDAAAQASRLRPRAPNAGKRATVAAFVHRAFWRSEVGDGSAEQYIGPVLSALETRLDRGDIAYVSVGPSANFRARRWWHPLRGVPAAAADGTTLPIESYAPRSALRASRTVWRDRRAARRALWNSPDIRERSIIDGCDCWPIIREELAGIALLQWPWSARAMDEAAAALDALRPDVAVTYAEAGGWGRAIVLECRRRRIASVGLQHGFIYRHWLNYLHDADEMQPDSGHPADRGFPAPDATLLFDDYAAAHLAERGRFPKQALRVTGSPRLDALAAQVGRLTTGEIEKAAASAGAKSRTMVLVTTKYKEAHAALPALVDAAGRIDGVQLVIKTHPAETPDVYASLAAGHRHVTVLDASAPLAPLLAASRAVVTVNSTVALDAAVLNVPALVIGLPNNLSPFVEAGLMSGADGPAIGGALEQILYDKEFRQQLARVREAFLARFHIRADGGAAERTAAAVLDAAGSTREP